MANPLLAGVGPQTPTSSEASAVVHQTIVAVNKRADRLRPAMVLSRDDDRSRDVDVDEVSDVTGRHVVSAGVRGRTKGDAGRLVLYVFEDEDGRTDKDFLPWTDLPQSMESYADRKRVEVESSRAARVAGGSSVVHGEDPRVSALTEEIDRLRADLSAAKRPERVGPSEPWDGFDSASLASIKEKLADSDDVEALKASVREYEVATKGDDARKGVLAATKPAE